MEASSSPVGTPQPDTLTTFLDTVDGEIIFFKSLTRYRPIGIHRFFNVLAISLYIHNKTGRRVTPNEIWTKLRSCYELEKLESFDLDTDVYGLDTESVPSPSPSQNLNAHPYFRQEFSLLDHDSQHQLKPLSTEMGTPQPPPPQTFESIIATRRLRDTPETPSPPPSTSRAASAIPVPSTPQSVTPDVTRLKSKLGKAGLVGGDSDSSDLTQESGDEESGGTNNKESSGRESVATGTGTDVGSDVEDVDVSMRGDSETEPDTAPPAAKRGRGRGRGSGVGRGRSTGPRGGMKKRKR